MSDDRWRNWGPLADRYREPRPRRILSLDGGGIRGVLSLEVLAELERQLRRHHGDEQLLLCDWFDLIGGTSTGAIIAAGLARGMSVAEVKAFYIDFGKQVFTRSKPWKLLWSLYDGGPLERQLKAQFGPRTTLAPSDLRCLLTVVTRNATTDSAWPISSNPAARYNDPARANCNLRIPLWQLVRASAAAPAYFKPEVISLNPADPDETFVFVDGGTTAHNNPAFLLYRMATFSHYRLGWSPGEQALLLISVGTGSTPVDGPGPDRPDSTIFSSGLMTLRALMSQISVDQDISCRSVGRCVHGLSIDREVGTMVPPEPLGTDLGRAFLYARYDAQLTKAGLRELGFSKDEIALDGLGKLDAVDRLDDLSKVGRRLGGRVDLAHFGGMA